MQFNIQLVKDYLTEHKITQKEFCKKCNIKQSELDKFFNHDKKMELDTLCAIAWIMDKDLYEMFARF